MRSASVKKKEIGGQNWGAHVKRVIFKVDIVVYTTTVLVHAKILLLTYLLPVMGRCTFVDSCKQKLSAILCRMKYEGIVYIACTMIEHI